MFFFLIRVRLLHHPTTTLVGCFKPWTMKLICGKVSYDKRALASNNRLRDTRLIVHEMKEYQQ
jgi:hypothetical protein